jgi:hypothetical protein
MPLNAFRQFGSTIPVTIYKKHIVFVYTDELSKFVILHPKG